MSSYSGDDDEDIEDLLDNLEDPDYLEERDMPSEYLALEDILDDKDYEDKLDEFLDSNYWTSEEAEDSVYEKLLGPADLEERLPGLEEFSIYEDETIIDVLDDNMEEQEFHRQELKEAYQQGNNYAVTVLLSTFFESYLSTKLSDWVDRNDTLLEPSDIQDGSMAFGEMIGKADRAGIFTHEKEKKMVDKVRKSRNEYVYNGFEMLQPENPTIIEREDLLDSAIDLYETHLGIQPEDRITEMEQPDPSELPDDHTETLEKMVENGSKVVGTTLLNDFFTQYMTQQLNNPGYGAYRKTGSKTDSRSARFDDLVHDFKNMHLGEVFHEDFSHPDFHFNHMVQIFKEVNKARKKYAHDLNAFAEGNGIDRRNYEDAVDIFHSLKDEVLFTEETYAPGENSGDRFGDNLPDN